MSLRFLIVVAICVTLAVHAANGLAGTAIHPLVSGALTMTPVSDRCLLEAMPNVCAVEGSSGGSTGDQAGESSSPVPLPYPKWRANVSRPSDLEPTA